MWFIVWGGGQAGPSTCTQIYTYTILLLCIWDAMGIIIITIIIFLHVAVIIRPDVEDVKWTGRQEMMERERGGGRIGQEDLVRKLEGRV